MSRKKKDGNVVLSVCSPDINLPENKGYVTSKGSVMVPIQLTLKGKWKLKIEQEGVSFVKSGQKQSIIRFECLDGRPLEVELVP